MDYPSKLAFDDYLQLVLLPALSDLRFARNKDDPNELFARAVLFETLDWLRFGVELGVYGRESARALLREYRLIVYEQCQLYPTELAYVLSPERLSGVLRMVESEDIEPEITFENPLVLHMTFQVLTDLVARADADQGARAFWTALLYLPESTWKVLASRQITGSGIMAVIRGEQDSWVDGSRSFVFAGHLRCIRHLEDALEALDHTHRIASIQDWVLFRQQFKKIHGWRHNNQKNSVVAARQLILTNMLGSAMNAEFTAAGGSIRADQFPSYVEDLYKRWDGLALPAVQFAAI